MRCSHWMVGDKLHREPMMRNVGTVCVVSNKATKFQNEHLKNVSLVKLVF